jgi:oligoribonuclease NrnB/cAMP/cGMP phosphodiesterase (DHH superfamily)
MISLHDNKVHLMASEQVFIAKIEPSHIFKKEKILLISHLKDFDGVGSAAIAKIAFGNKLERTIFSDFGKNAAEELKGELEKDIPKNSVVMFVDISMNEDAAEIYKELFKKLKEGNNLIVWLDHHPIGPNAKRVLDDYADFAIGGEQKICGAEVLLKYIIEPNEQFINLTNEKIGKINKIGEMAHISDFALRGTPYDKKLDEASYAISSYLDDKTGMQEGLNKIAEAIAKNVDEFDKDEFIEDRATLYKNKQTELKEELKSNSYLIGNKIKAIVGFNFSGSLQTNDGCSFLLGLDKAQKEGAKLAVYVKLGLGSVHLRSTDKAIDTSILAQKFGGNGHPPASAFPIPVEFRNIRSPEDMKRFAEYLEKEISETYEKLRVA